MRFAQLFFALVLTLSAVSNARAATYNFYFNNSEQGDDSKASPTVTVKDGADVNAKTDADADEVPSSQAAPVVVPAMAPEQPTREADAPTPTLEDRSEMRAAPTPLAKHLAGRWRVGSGFSLNFVQKKDSNYNDSSGYYSGGTYYNTGGSSSNYSYGDSYSNSTSSNVVGYYATGSLLLGEYFALSATLGNYASLEGEVTLAGHSRNGFQFAFLTGVMAALYDNNPTAGFFGGLRASIRAKNGLAYVLAAREVFASARSEVNSTQIDTGLQFYF